MANPGKDVRVVDVRVINATPALTTKDTKHTKKGKEY